MNHNNHHHLGVNRTGKNIRKSPIHQPNFHPLPPNQNRQQQQQNQPQVYNISKSDFRDVVQQLTGTPSRDPSPNPTPPPQPTPAPATAFRPPKATSLRLQKIRPPPLTPIARPNIPNHNNPNNFHYKSNQNPAALLPRPSPQQQVTASAFPPTPPTLWAGRAGVAESPVSLYMRYLENSVLKPEFSMQAQLGRGLPPHPQLPPQPQFQSQPHPQHPRSGVIQHPSHIQRSQLGPTSLQPPFSGPGFNSSRGPVPAPVPVPFPPVSPSPNAFMNLLSPHSPHPPLLSPMFQVPPPLSPTFFLSPLSRFPGSSGLLGPGPQTPHSPGLFFPPSPSWFVPSPRWGDLP
ncbi:VQ motif-containing protein [Zostera marina]|uniref:VQ motif-containing protein n=1 Tax=Zostera marina TaxID=29655 RepID=A0A0K9NVT1_ZOSMR|nr:VQ motif-containing protein [Zostera marina]